MAIGSRAGVLGVAGAVALTVGCAAEKAASLSASVRVISTESVCTGGRAAGSDCQVTSVVTVSIQEGTGREVTLESVSGVLWDTRGMQDMHAVPANLSAADIHAAAGSGTVAGRGRLDVPYTLAFTVVQLYILGRVKAMVHVRGRDSDGNLIEADGEGT